MTNQAIADLFERIADLLAIRGDNIHRILAYRKGAEAVRSAPQPVAELAAAGALTELPGIGATLAEKIGELVATGSLEFYNRLSAELPPSLVELLRVEGMGPKRVKLVYDRLGVTTLDGLRQAAEGGQLAALPGLGEKSAAAILANLRALERHGDGRVLLGAAWPLAHQIRDFLAGLPGVQQTAVAGSVRRMRETIGDLDLLVALDDGVDPAPIMRAFASLPMVEAVSGQGPTKTHVTLQNGMGADLRVLPTRNWGALLAYFTGSQAHNVRLRELAQKQGLSLNEYGFTRLATGEQILCPDEATVYATLGLPYIPPELREDRGEIEAAQRGRLPALVETGQIVADLHMHSTWSDGRASILEMAQTARARGLRTIVITDHSRSLGVANGLSIERLLEQAAEVRAVDDQMGPDFHVLHGTEMEIKADGSLDYPDEVLAQLDFVIASLHTGLKQPREQVTRRALAAIDNPHVDLLAHPTGRLLPERDGADLDMTAVSMAAAANGTFLEINCNPRRLDLSDVHARRAAELGVRLAINTDAHRPEDFDYLPFGVATARRAWVTAGQVVNTWSFERLLAHTHRHAA